ncbi:hypothetical protein N7494_012373 [Penicillium frequentans]|uniref:Fungal N-terminal domain-containing protein n=1 Tax=Penicillium frequentans TaxID=3151616 RepID=A0AAD6GAI5_9EURO|nr:hypothetical protein N7494_012373 [Penicillium glabrum]
MAEVIGVVSSAITFATVVAQVTNSIIRIKECWSQFRDAPDDLKYLMRELEHFGLIFANIEEDLSQEDLASALKNSKHVMQSLQFSREAATSLQELSDEMMRDMSSSSGLRKSYAVAKAVMKRGKLEKRMARLRNAIQSLSLSQQCYTRALIRVQPDLIAKKLVQGKSTTPDFKLKACPHQNRPRGDTPELLNHPTERALQGEISNHSYTSKYSWRLSLPTWLCTKALEVYGERLCYGWQWVFRTHNTIPSTSKVFKLAIAGDVEGLQKLFAMGQASPFDRADGYGLTLLHYAVARPRNERVLKFLLDQGLDPSSTITSLHGENETPLFLLFHLYVFYSATQDELTIRRKK